MTAIREHPAHAEHLSASFSATIRVELENRPGAFAEVAAAIAGEGGLLDAIDLVRVDDGSKVRDVTVLAADADHIGRIVDAVREVEGVEVQHVSDRTFLLHLGGKLEMRAKSPIKTRDDLSMAYTPGVARICRAIADEPSKVWNLTIKQHAVAVVTDGTAVLGLGDIGPEAALPVMEGKAILFKEFGGVDAWPICLATKDVDEIVACVSAIAPGFGGINLEDISAPRCFEIEDRLRARLDIPVFHDDQHGTAVVVLAALLNALKVVGKRLDEISVVVTGVGAAGVATTKMLLAAGVRDIIGCDRQGVIWLGRPGLDGYKLEYALSTNPRGVTGCADDALLGADVYIGLSGPGVVSPEGVGSMARDAIVFVMANPTPEVLPEEIEGSVAVDRHRALGLPEPDQQCPCLPGHHARRARRARIGDHRGDEARRRPRDRRGDPGRSAGAGLHHPERLRPQRRLTRRQAPSQRRRGSRAWRAEEV